MTNLEPYRQQWIKRLEAEKVRLEAVRKSHSKRRDMTGVVVAEAAIDTVRNDLVFLDSIGHMVELRGVVS